MSDNNSNYLNKSNNDSFESYNNIFNDSFEKNKYFEQELENFFYQSEKTQEISNEKETALKIMEDSSVTIQVNKKGEEPFFNYDNIKYDNGQNQISFDELKNVKINGKCKNLEKNYQKFVDFLEEIVNYMKKEFNNKFKFQIDLIFKMEKNKSNKNKNKNNQDIPSFIVDCLYKVNIPGEEIMVFQDNNILVNGASEGLIFLINEIKYGNYEN